MGSLQDNTTPKAVGHEADNLSDMAEAILHIINAARFLGVDSMNTREITSVIEYLERLPELRAEHISEDSDATTDTASMPSFPPNQKEEV